MLGAIAGDVIGSPFEHRRATLRDFPLFAPSSTVTDDSVLTVAVAAAIVDAQERALPYPAYCDFILSFARRWPHAGYGGSFRQWMRSAAVTHDHPDGIAGAQAVALAVHLARTGAPKRAIRLEVASRFGYDLDRTVEQIRSVYSFDVSCQGSVPEAIVAFLDSDDFESAVRNAVWLDGDADTQACIAGAIAEAFYGRVPEGVEREVRGRVPGEFARTVDAVTGAPPADGPRS